MPRINRTDSSIQAPQKSLRRYVYIALSGTLALLLAANASGLPPSSPTTGAFNSVTVSDANQHFAYALVSARDGSNIMLATSKDVRDIENKRTALAKDFLWVREENRHYLVTNPAVLAQAQALWSPVREIAGQIDKLDQDKDAKHGTDQQDSQIQALKQKQEAEVKIAELKLRELIRETFNLEAGKETSA